MYRLLVVFHKSPIKFVISFRRFLSLISEQLTIPFLNAVGIGLNVWMVKVNIFVGEVSGKPELCFPP